MLVKARDNKKMNKKYYGRTGETAFRLWVFSTMLEELKNNTRNPEKVANLLGKVTAFANGNWIRYNGTDEEKDDVAIILQELEALK